MKLNIVLALLFTVLLCVSCMNETPADVEKNESQTDAIRTDGIITDWQSYTIVRPENTDDKTIEALQLLKNSITEKLGVELTPGTDWIMRGEDIPVGTKEILIGATNRPESVIDEDILYNDYFISFENDRLAIGGGNGEAVLEAVNWYIENCITDTLHYPDRPYISKGEYPMPDSTLGGVRLAEIEQVVYTSDYLKETAVNISEIIANLCGVKPTVSNKITNDVKNIQLGCSANDERIADLALNEAIINWVDNTFLVATNGSTLFPHTFAVELFLSEILGNTDAQNSLETKVTVMKDKYQIATDGLIDEYMDIIDQKIIEIKSSETNIEYTGTAYYVSADGNDKNDGKSPETPWKTIAKVNTHTFKTGDCVFFKRGDSFRIIQQYLRARDGVTYSAYGEGDKPMFICSVDGSGADQWTEVHENIYRYAEKIPDTRDVGTIVFNGGNAWGIQVQKLDGSNKRLDNGTVFNGIEYVTVTDMKFEDERDLQGNLEFWHDWETDTLYLYCSMGNPGEVFDSIEIVDKGHGIGLEKENIVIDNIAIFGAGSHGIGGGNIKNVTIQYCTFEWIGGSIQDRGIFGRNYGTRYGNAVESYGSSENFVIHDCYATQVYDCCWTAQYLEGATINNLHFYNNVSEYCTTGAEVWSHGGSESAITNMKIHDNYTRFAGYGWAHQRPTKDGHFFYGADGLKVKFENNDIQNNVFIFARAYGLYVQAAGPRQFNFHDNVYIMESDTQLLYYRLDPSYIIENNPSEEEAILKEFAEFEKGAKYYVTDPDPCGDMFRYYIDHDVRK